nr:immunoglobulin heavy chain junction region [Mus musculus]
CARSRGPYFDVW